MGGPRTSIFLRQKKFQFVLVAAVVVFLIVLFPNLYDSEDYEKEYPLLLENEQLVICYESNVDSRKALEIRYTKKVSMFPVGLIGDYGISSPIVRNGRVEGFFDSWPAKRKWPVDMAGFAVSLEYLALSPNATMPFKAGYEEDEFLKSIGLKLEDIEPKARNCTEILVWHTQTKSSKSPTVRISMDRQKLDKLNLGALLRRLESMGVNHISESEGTTAQAIVNGSVKPFSFWFS
uniref:Galactosylgalactosylxylosylprotein 3-beta-glucuronosyltransferase n=1 Tax=Anopheles coluzzii TaxID=1518534 RepID=A0A8W7PYZ7_ANOCL